MFKAGARIWFAASAEDGVEGVPRMAVGSVRVLLRAVLGSTCYKMPQRLQCGMVQMTHAAHLASSNRPASTKQRLTRRRGGAEEEKHGERKRDWPHTESAESTE